MEKEREPERAKERETKKERERDMPLSLGLLKGLWQGGYYRRQLGWRQSQNQSAAGCRA
jgi:hypothetical protein